MTAAFEPRRAIFNWWFALSVAAMTGFVVMEVYALADRFFPSPSREEHALCDQAVAALVHSKDPVEIERAGIIIRELSCAIGRRLRTEP